MSAPPDYPIPAWALAKVEAALKIGLTMPEIEKVLVAKGLSEEMAKVANRSSGHAVSWRSSAVHVGRSQT